MESKLFPKGTYPINNPVYLDDETFTQPKECFKQLIGCIKSSNLKSPISIIDVGCASGGFLNYAFQHLSIHHAVGMDVSNEHLELAKNHLPNVEFIQDSIIQPTQKYNEKFDICTCLGTIATIDEFEVAIKNLIGMLEDHGVLYIYDIVNDDPIDVLMRYRVAEEATSEWVPGFNVRSKVTWERVVRSIDKDISIEWEDFDLPFDIPKDSDAMRAWTIKTESNKRQLVVGTGQLLNFKIIKINKSQ